MNQKVLDIINNLQGLSYAELKYVNYEVFGELKKYKTQGENNVR